MPAVAIDGGASLRLGGSALLASKAGTTASDLAMIFPRPRRGCAARDICRVNRLPASSSLGVERCRWITWQRRRDTDVRVHRSACLRVTDEIAPSQFESPRKYAARKVAMKYQAKVPAATRADRGLQYEARTMEAFMKNVIRIASVSLLALVVASRTAHADPGKTRAQVQAELVAAEKAGDVVEGEDGLTPRERFPWLYPASADSAPAKTRAQVQAELATAEKAGDVVEGEDGLTPRERFPGLFPPEDANGPAVTREQVRADLAAAQNAGEIPQGFAAIALRDLTPGRYSNFGPTQDQAHASISSTSSGTN